MKTLGDYNLGNCEFSNEQLSEYSATDFKSGDVVKLIRFSQPLCEQGEFRAEFRKDLPTLKTLKHFHILSVIDWGESNGQLFYTSERPEGDRLSHASLNELSWDQLADLAWQLTSAIQHAHNVGLSHGGLSHDWVFVSAQLRIQVGGFGVQYWINKSDGTLPDEVSRHESDTRQIACVIRDLLQQNPNSSAKEFAPLWEIVEAGLAKSDSLTARDIQRRLGKLLLRDTDDSIDMVDERAGQSLHRRSLVDELFDDLPQSASGETTSRKSNKRVNGWKAACVSALLGLLALGIWRALS